METGTDIKKAASLIRKGGLVAFPTETVYGLGANGLDPIAVAKIFAVKQRPSFDPLILHVGNPEMARELFAQPDNMVVKMLMQHFWPGPLTIVAQKQDIVPDIVTSGMDTVAVRMPDNPYALDLIREAGVPVAAPSANLFGRLSPTQSQHVRKQLKGIDYLVEGGQTRIGLESTIVSVEEHGLRLLRPGHITTDQIREAIPGIVIRSAGENEDGNKIQAPGQLKSHYSPEKPLYIFRHTLQNPGPSAGVILFTMHPGNQMHPGRTIILSPRGDLLEAAANLFSALHEMENDPLVGEIHIQAVEEKGIGIAMMDRIRKAAHRHQS